MKIDQFPEHIKDDILPKARGDMFYRCLGCENEYGSDQLLDTCPNCGSVFLLHDRNTQYIDEVGGRKWRDISLEHLMEKDSGNTIPNLLADPGIDPGLSSEQREIVDLIKRMIREELTEKQRKALVAITVHNMPLDELARRMKTNRNALNKLLHDARLRLKKGLAREGLSPETIINAFT